MAQPSHSSLFEKAMTVIPIDSSTYSANLDPAWCIGTVPHGGYTASVLYRTATIHFARKYTTRKQLARSPEPIGLQISFLRRTFTGPAILTVQEIKLGSRVSTIHVTLSQKPNQPATTKKLAYGSELEIMVAAFITMSPPDTEQGPVIKGLWDLSPPMPHGSLSDGSIDFKALAEDGIDGTWVLCPQTPPALHAAKHLRIFSPSHTLSAMRLEDRTKQIVDQWAQFAPGGKPAKWSNEAVLYLADMFPAALTRMEAMETSRLLALEGETGSAKSMMEVPFGQFWFPTVTMNVDLKTRLPPQGVEWLHSRVVTRMLRGSRADLDVMILDQKGELIATSSQVALVVDGSRNIRGRQDSGRL
ncbi:uncharacterized protein N7496_002781 [Penicillium cataractarum]|uniref:Thioesterase-like superfamily-domain-containing protein n=1 Tax=Penicillium cataractarum TaxID=2100454 RepID=A0A9W9SPY4_9EURO|nr:uncharacterized protein N7496_002781 [Penicillium cataractarum]KAJ5380353.1 hypothetical protein N7496_002781 [Penicillium cataractarum]